MSFWKKISSSVVLTFLLVASSPAIATALQSSSAHYGIDQAQFGSGSALCDTSNPTSSGSSHSANYCASQSLGEIGVGDSASTHYKIQAGGTVTDRETSLTLVVDNPAINVGTLTNTTTKVGSATFSVLSYLADGYAVYTSSPGPQNGNYTMHTLSSAAASSAGNEQFGMNLVANSCPAASVVLPAVGGCTTNFGASPVQVPDTSFSFGKAAPGYDTAGSYKYKNGDEIAYSDSSSGQTNYTMAYIFNITPTTPGGTYTMDQSIVVASTF